MILHTRRCSFFFYFRAFRLCHLPMLLVNEREGKCKASRCCRRGMIFWRRWQWAGRQAAGSSTVSRRSETTPSTPLLGRTCTLWRETVSTWPPACRRGTTRNPTTITTHCSVKLINSVDTTLRYSLSILFITITIIDIFCGSQNQYSVCQVNTAVLPENKMTGWSGLSFQNASCLKITSGIVDR